MSRVQICFACACIVVMTVGCRGRCNNPNGGWFAGNSTLAPPATYSLNIPSVASNQPYYTPGQAPPTNATLNPNQSAPTAAGQTQAGWRPANDGLGNQNTSQPDAGRSVLTSQTKFVETQPRNSATMSAGQVQPRMAALPGSGVSFTNSQNYQTTPFDERRDATRLPVTDASTVRAPARNFPTGNVVQFQQQYVNPAAYGVPQQTYVAQNGYYQQPNGYSGSMVMLNGQPASYQGQTFLVNQNPGYSNGAPTVLAQATTSVDSQSPSQVGWRSRELNSDRINR